jgi:hypothetical protein
MSGARLVGRAAAVVVGRGGTMVVGVAIAAAAVASSAAAGPVSGAAAATAQQTIALLNVQRAANRLPAGITNDPTWSSDCAAHDRYMARNHVLTHTETPGNPGYSSGGAFAGLNAVLTQGGSWDNGNPYENEPLHLDPLLAPRLVSVGSADIDGFSCTTTFPGWTRPAPPALTVYTYPGNGSTIYASEVARELPWTPGDLVGIPQPTRTGPNLIVLVDAAEQSLRDNPATLTGATLTGPSGPVQVATVDGDTPVPSGPYPTLGPYISPGGFIIPLNPLTPGSTYRAHVVVSFAGSQTIHNWTFSVQGADPNSRLSVRGHALSFTSQSSHPVEVTFTRAGGQHAPGVGIRPGHSVHLSLRPGTWQACGHQAATDTFAGYDRCIGIVVTGTPVLHLGKPQVHGARVRFRLAFGAVLRGRTATLTTTALTFHCAHRICTIVTGRPSTRVIMLQAKHLSFPLPARGHGLRIAIGTSAFQLADAPWTAAHAIGRYVRT